MKSAFTVEELILNECLIFYRCEETFSLIKLSFLRSRVMKAKRK